MAHLRQRMLMSSAKTSASTTLELRQDGSALHSASRLAEARMRITRNLFGFSHKANSHRTDTGTPHTHSTTSTNTLGRGTTTRDGRQAEQLQHTADTCRHLRSQDSGLRGRD